MSDPVFTGKARPHYFLDGNVYDAALNRIRWLFDEFDGRVSVSTSGGKDSAVVTELAIIVARERGELPLKLHFLDQEAEYQATIDYMRELRDRPEVDLDWYQIPFRLFNASSHAEQWTHVWDDTLDDNKWIRPKEPNSIKVNDFFTKKGKQIDRFKEVLNAMNVRDGGAILTGMRCEESPTRRVFMTSVPTYKWVTWASGSFAKKGFSLFHPIYDWSYRDVWKSIYDNDWAYNDFYNKMFRYGVSLRGMRVSSFHHESSQGSLDFLQELEPETWERATRRIKGLNTYNQVGEDIAAHYMHHRPYMFDTWNEYLEYLIDNLVVEESDKTKFRKMTTNAEHVLPYVPRTQIAKCVLYMVMFNDVYGSNMATWISSQKNPGKKREWDQWKRDNKAKGLYSEDEEIGRAK